jgi:hypothetical protein
MAAAHLTAQQVLQLVGTLLLCWAAATSSATNVALAPDVAAEEAANGVFFVGSGASLHVDAYDAVETVANLTLLPQTEDGSFDVVVRLLRACLLASLLSSLLACLLAHCKSAQLGRWCSTCTRFLCCASQEHHVTTPSSRSREMQASFEDEYTAEKIITSVKSTEHHHEVRATTSALLLRVDSCMMKPCLAASLGCLVNYLSARQASEDNDASPAAAADLCALGRRCRAQVDFALRTPVVFDRARALVAQVWTRAPAFEVRSLLAVYGAPCIICWCAWGPYRALLASRLMRQLDVFDWSNAADAPACTLSF